jgi:hypothetical protein
MIRKGYIERQTEMLALALAKVLRLKRGGDGEGALVEVRVASKKLVGLDLETTLTALPEPTLLSLFTASDGDFDAGRCFTAATLLAERAELLEERGRTDASRPLFPKALALLLEALLREEILRTAENRARVEALLARLDGQALPTSLQQRLLRYREVE